MPEHMNPDFPNARGCWIDTRVEGKVVVSDYPTWREKNEPGNLPPYWNKNEPIQDGRTWQKEFATVEEAEAFMKEENYVKCDMPASLRPKREAKTASRDVPDWEV